MMMRMNNSSTFRHLLSGMLLVVSLWGALPVADAYAITLKQAVSQIERQYNGKIVSARTVTRAGKRVHVIRVITKEGVVKTVQIPE